MFAGILKATEDVTYAEGPNCDTFVSAANQGTHLKKLNSTAEWANSDDFCDLIIKCIGICKLYYLITVYKNNRAVG